MEFIVILLLVVVGEKGILGAFMGWLIYKGLRWWWVRSEKRLYD